MSVDDAGQDAIAASLVGRTITKATAFHADDSASFPQGEDHVWIYLDDGRVIEIAGWGYDAWGADLEVIEVVPVPACAHCGKDHGDSRVYIADGTLGLDRLLPQGTRYTFCIDGNHKGWIEEAK